ncbi:hypothetical protein HDU97_009174 [Phlyctochytrium planicorne]|nr:hypothetical protein HDU97_009174 [Phlyctochytrium planicorne]
MQALLERQQHQLMQQQLQIDKLKLQLLSEKHSHPSQLPSLSPTSKYMSAQTSLSSIVNAYQSASASYGDNDLYSPVDEDVPRLTSESPNSVESSAAKSLDELMGALKDTIFELEMQEARSPVPRSPVPQSFVRRPSLPEVISGPRMTEDTYSVESLLALPTAYYGYLHKLSLSKATGQRLWKPRFFILHDSNLYLFRSEKSNELPMTFLPLSSASGCVAEDPENLPHHNQTSTSGYRPDWIIDVRGSGYSPDGSIVERSWALYSHDESVMSAWLDRMVPIIGRRRGSAPDSSRPFAGMESTPPRPRRESLASPSPYISQHHQQLAYDNPHLMLRRPSDAIQKPYYPTGYARDGGRPVSPLSSYPIAQSPLPAPAPPRNPTPLPEIPSIPPYQPQHNAVANHLYMHSTNPVVLPVNKRSQFLDPINTGLATSNAVLVQGPVSASVHRQHVIVGAGVAPESARPSLDVSRPSLDVLTGRKDVEMVRPSLDSGLARVRFQLQDRKRGSVAASSSPSGEGHAAKPGFLTRLFGASRGGQRR